MTKQHQHHAPSLDRPAVAAGELSDADLEQVAGGTASTTTTTTTTSNLLKKVSDISDGIIGNMK